MMSLEALQSLREVNHNLGLALFRLRPENQHVSMLGSHEFFEIRKQVAYAAKCLQMLSPLSGATDEVKKELLDYQHNLETLKHLLPDVHARLLAEKSRLEKARTHTAAAAGWAAQPR